MSSTSHISKQKALSRQIKARVMQLLGWNEFQYGEFVYKSGTAYLQSYIPNDPQGIDALVSSKVYWNWWRIHWMRRDEEFVQVADNMTADQRRDNYSLISGYYEELHNPTILAKEIFPNSAILNESYSKMIGDFIKNER